MIGKNAVAAALVLCMAAAGMALEPFHFTVTADNRGYSGFANILAQIDAQVGGPGVFHVSPGDIDPPAVTRSQIDAQWGSLAIWYPGVGNHEAETPSDMAWIRNEFASLPYIVNSGPANGTTTSYSWDYGNAHFVMLNEYYNGLSDVGTDGDVVDALYDWLAADLAANTQPVVFVFGHEPAFPQPDANWGDARHVGDSLDKYPAHRDRFWNLLESQAVQAYINGHTHRYSRYRRPGGNVWQVDAAQARGGSRYDTFIDVTVDEVDIRFDVWRDLDVDGQFAITDSWTTPVPEPATAMLLGATGLALLYRRRLSARKGPARL